MNKLFIVTLIISTFGSFATVHAQSKPSTVVKPQYNYDFNTNTSNQNGVGNIPNNIVVSDQPEITVASTSIDTEITVTTELGEVTLPLATSSREKEEEPERLAVVVDRINQDYETSVEECRNGSWLEKIWCKISRWF